MVCESRRNQLPFLLKEGMLLYLDTCTHSPDEIGPAHWSGCSGGDWLAVYVLGRLSTHPEGIRTASEPGMWVGLVIREFPRWIQYQPGACVVIGHRDIVNPAMYVAKTSWHHHIDGIAYEGGDETES